MSDQPEGFIRTAEDGAVLVLRADVAATLRAAGLSDPTSVRSQALRTFVGRGEPFALSVAGVGDVFVRPYVHGGLLAPLTGDRFSGDGRFAAEVAVLAACAAAGVPVPEVLGYVSRSVSRAVGLGLRKGWLLTREVPGAVDLLAYLADAAPSERQGVLRTAGQACRALHDEGVEHPDLHWKNLLVAAPDRVLVLDLDGARAHAEPLDQESRRRALLRCDRYAAKQAARGHRLTRTDRLRFLRAYAGADWPDRAEVRRWATDLARHIGRHQTSLSAKAAPLPESAGADA